MKSLFFDSGPLMSLTMNNLLGILQPLKEKFGGEFYITPAVRKELVERPLEIKRFEFEALQILKLLREGTLKLYEKPLKGVIDLSTYANKSIIAKDKGCCMEIIHGGELETVAASLQEGNDTVAIDERTIRLLMENSEELKSLIEARLHEKVILDKKMANQFQSLIKGMKVIRSAELVGMAYQFGILDNYLPPLKSGREILLDSVLWGLKLKGCAIIGEEIEELKRVLLK
ncbi:hypothetical protein J4417_04920 [Candidatus Woesearchaeota archaeon]|nr:hypothetical protein [Candidatus Woesearchaeota archaeon]